MLVRKKRIFDPFHFHANIMNEILLRYLHTNKGEKVQQKTSTCPSTRQGPFDL